MALLTKRERKLSECLGAAIALKRKRECDKELDMDVLIERIIEAVDALIVVLGDEEIAEQLSLWEEDFYQSTK
jgi:hypothetical protein